MPKIVSLLRSWMNILWNEFFWNFNSCEAIFNTFAVNDKKEMMICIRTNEFRQKCTKSQLYAPMLILLDDDWPVASVAQNKQICLIDTVTGVINMSTIPITNLDSIVLWFFAFSLSNESEKKTTTSSIIHSEFVLLRLSLRKQISLLAK